MQFNYHAFLGWLTGPDRYTKFEYQYISISGDIGTDSSVQVSVTVKNVGQVAGREVV